MSLFRSRSRPRGVPVLMLHGVCESVPDWATYREARSCLLGAEAFGELLEWLSARYRFVGVSELEAALEAGADPPPVALTFDDGLASVVEHAVPALREVNAVATTFITTGWTDAGRTPAVFEAERAVWERSPATVRIAAHDGRSKSFDVEVEVASRGATGDALQEIWSRLFEARLPPLSLTAEEIRIDGIPLSEVPYGGEGEDPWKPASWDGLRDAIEEGVLEAGSHMTTHTPLAWLTEDEIRDEMRSSRERLESEFGRPARACAYPHGVADQRVARIASDHYEWSFLNRGGILHSGDDPALAPRIHVHGDDPGSARKRLTGGDEGMLRRRFGRLRREAFGGEASPSRSEWTESG